MSSNRSIGEMLYSLFIINTCSPYIGSSTGRIGRREKKRIKENINDNISFSKETNIYLIK